MVQPWNCCSSYLQTAWRDQNIAYIMHEVLATETWCRCRIYDIDYRSRIATIQYNKLQSIQLIYYEGNLLRLYIMHRQFSHDSNYVSYMQHSQHDTSQDSNSVYKSAICYSHFHFTWSKLRINTGRMIRIRVMCARKAPALNTVALFNDKYSCICAIAAA